MKDKIKVVLDVTSLFVAFAVVMFTAGTMFIGIADFTLKDVIIACAIIFGIGCLNVWLIIQHVIEFVKLKTKENKR
tara:strand:- start:156 stop:383 length:228 start_codon:yes stop_codon:yes gene_type:complete